MHQRTTGSRRPPLAAVNPALAAEWDVERNELTPDEVTDWSHKKVWWICAKTPSHRWQARVANRSQGRGCPMCAGRVASPETSFAAVNPAIAAEWDVERNDLTPDEVTSGSSRKVWWICAKNPSHRWRATINHRSNGRGCPMCAGRGWIGRELTDFLAGIGEHVDDLQPAELFAIATALHLSEQATKRLLVSKVRKRKLYVPEDDTGDTDGGWEAGSDDDWSGTPDGSSLQTTGVGDGPGGCGSSGETVTGAAGDPITVQAEVEKAIQAAEASLRVLGTNDDHQLASYLLQGRVNALWKLAYLDPKAVHTATRRKRKDKYEEKVRSAFRQEFDLARNLPIPCGWAFAPTGTVVEPNLMQRHVAAMMLQRRQYGNWSGTGAGKTVSAVLSALALKAGRGKGIIIVVCPNNTVDGWVTAIEGCHPDNRVATKTWDPHWETGSGPKWLVVNYEKLSDTAATDAISGLLAKYRIDLLVVDEVHFTKERENSPASRRRATLMDLRSKAGEANPKLRVLGMSATPAVNEPRETVSLLEVLRGEDLSHMDTGRTTEAAMRIHQELVLTGTRWKPDYSDIGVIDTPTRIDISHLYDDIIALGRTPSALELEMVLMEGKLETIVKECLRGGRTLIYTEFRTGIVDMLTSAIEDVGLRVGHFTGRTKQLARFVGFDPVTGDPVPVDHQVDVLIGTQAIGTGVDGLQHIADRLVFATLPWTSAGYAQIVGRVVRQGRSKDQQVEIVTPITYISAQAAGAREDWSMDQYRHDTITSKKTLIDAIVDGDLPTGTRLPSPQKVTAALLERIAQLECAIAPAASPVED